MGYIDINNYNSNLLPYITIRSLNNKPLKFLIDTGSNKSFISPDVELNESINIIDPVKIKTIFNTQFIKNEVTLKGLREFDTINRLSFLIFKFHSYFDGLIGTEIMKDLGMKIDLKN